MVVGDVVVVVVADKLRRVDGDGSETDDGKGKVVERRRRKK